MEIVLFDLDHTIINGDTDFLWGKFLVENNIVDKNYYESKNEYFFQEYQAGSLDPLEFARFSYKPLADNDYNKLLELRKTFFTNKIRNIFYKDAVEIIKDNHKDVPILGICLGHQAIGMSFGGNIIQSKSIVHGKVSTINIYPSKIFNNTDKQIRVVRYHSLVIDNLNFPPSLTVIANLENGTIMGLEHVKYPVFGIQFHPESIDTQFGKKIIKNFLEL